MVLCLQRRHKSLYLCMRNTCTSYGLIHTCIYIYIYVYRYVMICTCTLLRWSMSRLNCSCWVLFDLHLRITPQRNLQKATKQSKTNLTSKENSFLQKKTHFLQTLHAMHLEEVCEDWIPVWRVRVFLCLSRAVVMRISPPGHVVLGCPRKLVKG